MFEDILFCLPFIRTSLRMELFCVSAHSMRSWHKRSTSLSKSSVLDLLSLSSRLSFSDSSSLTLHFILDSRDNNSRDNRRELHRKGESEGSDSLISVCVCLLESLLLAPQEHETDIGRRTSFFCQFLSTKSSWIW